MDHEEILRRLRDPARLDALRRIGLLDSPPEPAFDRVTRLAAALLQAPCAFLAFLDDRRQFFKSARGLPAAWGCMSDAPVEHSFCKHVVAGAAPLVVPDAREHPLLRHTPGIDASGIVAYLSVPVLSADGFVLGTLCVTDSQPRQWTPEQLAYLQDLVDSVTNKIRLMEALQQAREAQRAAEAMQQRLWTTLESVTDAFYALDPEWCFTYVNAAAERLMARPRQELLGRNAWDEFPAALGLSIETEFRAAMRTGQPRRFEAFYPPLDTWFAASVYPSAEGLAVYFRDVSEQRRQETERRDAHLRLEQRVQERTAELQASNNLLRAVLDGSADAIFMKDMAGRYLLANPAMARLMKLERPEALLGRADAELLPPEKALRVAADERAVHESGESDVSELSLQTRRGPRTFVTSRTLLRDTAGRPARLVGVTRETTEQKRMEDELRRSEERYRAFVSRSAEGIYRLELREPLDTTLPVPEQLEAFLRHAFVAECNDALARMYGYERAEELIGAGLDQVVPPDEPAGREHMAAFLAGGYSLTNCESREKDRLGTTKYFLNNLIGTVEGGALRHVWGTLRDQTHGRHLEEQLLQAQKMEAVGRLAGGIAHDFNNLLTVIQGHTELLLAGAPPPLQPGLREVHTATRRAVSLTRQLLAFSRKQIVQPRPLLLDSVLGGMERMAQRLIGEDVELRLELQAPSAVVRADPGQLEQVLLNLVVNARDAMPGGGTVTIRTRQLPEPPAHAAKALAPSAAGYALLEVADTGCGMSAEVREHLFEPFFTTKPAGQGTGLGLSTVYGIVTQSGGTLEVQSEPGAGAVFRICLPGTTERPARPARATRPAEMPHGSETVLLAEDDAQVREIVAAVLRRCGYQVLTAQNGAAALDLARAHRGPLDLVLTDIVMPQMGGREFVERLRAERAGFEVLYMSGHTDDEIVRRGIATDALHFLHKPVVPAALARAVRCVLDHRTAPAAAR